MAAADCRSPIGPDRFINGQNYATNRDKLVAANEL